MAARSSLFRKCESAVVDLARLCRHRTVSQAVQLLLWQVPTKISSLLAMAWIIQCLGPKNLGISAIVNVVASMVVLFTNLGLDIVGPRRLATNKADAKEIIESVQGLRWRLCFVFSIIWLAGILVFQPGPEARFAWLMGISSMIMLGLSTTWAFQGVEELPVQGKVVAISSVITVALAMLFLRPGAAAGCDTVVNVIGSGVGLAVAWSFLRKHTGARFFAPINWAKTTSLVFGARWAFGVTVMLAVYSQIDLVMVACLAGIEQAGLYRAAVALTSPLVNLLMIANALLYPRLAAWHQGSPSLLWNRQKQLAMAAFLVGVFLVAAAFVLRRPLIHLVCGDEFYAAATPFVILFGAKIIRLIHMAFAWGVMAAGRDGRFLISAVCAAIISFAGNLLLIPRGGIIAAAFVSLVAELSILITAAYFGWREYQRYRVAPDLSQQCSGSLISIT